MKIFSTYLKISRDFEFSNQNLMHLIIIIGKYYVYGYNNDQKISDWDALNAGIKYLAKKVKGATQTSVKNMLNSHAIINSTTRQWRFKKRVYERTYNYIIYRILEPKFLHDNRYMGKALNLKLYEQYDAEIDAFLHDAIVNYNRLLNAGRIVENDYQYYNNVVGFHGDNLLTNAIVYYQSNTLIWANDKNQYIQDSPHIYNILKAFVENDKKYTKRMSKI